MARWTLQGSKNFADCIYRVVNLLGDADTTGAIAGQIAGQIAGAFYGYQVFSSDPLSARMLKNLHRWDPLHEIPLRALLLNREGDRAE
ncbi:ADP-ribosylglycohydrolase family protein [bacterium]|nr:ADP-ribosylglycohydrolase family protein [Rhodopirellula sp.]MDA7878173.1 ADP-ribosylglycohydrolase family protein [bacterium]